MNRLEGVHAVRDQVMRALMFSPLLTVLILSQQDDKLITQKGHSLVDAAKIVQHLLNAPSPLAEYDIGVATKIECLRHRNSPKWKCPMWAKFDADAPDFAAAGSEQYGGVCVPDKIQLLRRHVYRFPVYGRDK